MRTAHTPKLRVRCGSWRTFERRFEPMPAPNHDLLWELRGEVPADADHFWWTVVDYHGRLYVTPGFRFVNRFACIRCAVPWTDDDERQPDYRYDCPGRYASRIGRQARAAHTFRGAARLAAKGR